MNKIYTLLVMVVFALINNTKAQIPCYDAPSLNFSGTPVVFSYLLEDTIIIDWCQGIVLSKHRGDLFTKPLEYDDMYIISAKTITGSVILGIDQNTNEINWSRYYNHLVNNQQRSMTIGAYRKRGGDSLEMLTYHSLSVFDGNSMNAISGFPGRRIINYKTGETLFDYWVGDSLKVEGVDFSNLIYILFMGTDKFPDHISGSDMYHFANPISFRTDSSSFKINHRFVDTTTLIPYWQDAPLFQLQGIATPSIFLDCRENGVQPTALETFGPFVLPGDRKMYLLRYLLGGFFRSRKVVLDKWGYLLENEELTQNMGENNNNGLTMVSDIYQTTNNHLIILGSVQNKQEFWEYGHGSYIVIDTSGNLIKARKKLLFDGLRPFLHNVCEIPLRNSLLHVFRPQENNDLYFYEEFEDGSYRKAGHLVNPNSSFYAFDPHQIGILNNGDIFVHLTAIIDSVGQSGGINNFDSGGWKGMIRVDGKTLGITTSTKDLANTLNTCKIYPNPASTEIKIDKLEATYPMTGQIYNKLGQIVRSFNLMDSGQTVDVSSLPSDMYFVQLFDQNGNKPAGMGKWVKE